MNNNDNDNVPQQEYSIWHFYAFAGFMLVLYGMVMKPKEKTLRNLWIGYVVAAAILGFMNN